MAGPMFFGTTLQWPTLPPLWTGLPVALTVLGLRELEEARTGAEAPVSLPVLDLPTRVVGFGSSQLRVR
jgi:hypothetical protein